MAPAATHTLAILHRLGELKKKKSTQGWEREVVKGVEGTGGEAVGDGFDQKALQTCMISNKK